MPEFVRIPRAQFATWWPRPWPEVLAAAEAGEDGLRVEMPDQQLYTSECAYVHEGAGTWGRGKTCLFQQNW